MSHDNRELRPEICVIGAGPGGLPVAAAAATFDSVLIEKGPMGSESLNRGSVPAQALMRWPYRENDRAQVERATEGHIKVVTDCNGEILGVTIVGSNAAESIAPWTLAISEKLNIRALASMIVPYPTFAEVRKRAAITYFTQGLTTLGTRRIMGWLHRWR